ncbi:GDYXXLXY domain-containing protein [Trichloromonas sp.]|uniref:GDYXXLXY domain-containing protein n=1 Tax=Trichloromonas sp. TaxID=3069249 RepID=UPI003D813273
MKKPLILFFVVIVLAQLAVPGWMIVRRELALAEGAAYRFRTAPVDPYDPFRGRYVMLNLEAASAPVAEGESYRSGEKVYALLENDDQGYVRVGGLVRDCPETGDYLRVRVSYQQADRVQLGLPFDRYYAEESIAPGIERAYWKHSRQQQRDAYVLVRVRKGMGVIEELYIEGLPVLEFIAQEQRKGTSGD